MKIYRVELLAPDGFFSDGFEWRSSKREANLVEPISEGGTTNITVFDVPTRKGALIGFLNRYCSYPDNG